MVQFTLIIVINCFMLDTYANRGFNREESPSFLINDTRKVVNVGIVLHKKIFSTLLEREFIPMLKQNNDIYDYSKYYKLNVVKAYLEEKMYPMKILNILCDILIKQQVVVILYWSNDESYGQTTAILQYFMHLVSYTGIPIVAWNADNSGLLVNRDLNKYRLLQMAPNLEHQATAMLQILMRYNWKKFAVVVSSIAGGDYFSGICRKIIRTKNLELQVVGEYELKTNNLTALNENLKLLSESEARIFLLYATQEEAKIIFESAKTFSLTDAKHMWIATQSVVKDETWKEHHSRHSPYGMMATHFNTKSGFPEDKYKGLALYEQSPNLFKAFKMGLDSLLRSYNYSIDFASTSNCDSDYNYTWHMGEEFYKHLKTVKFSNADVDVDGHIHQHPRIPIEFDDSGYLKESHLSILNLKADGIWEKIGEYFNNNLTINDIAWPGGMHQPPAGLPEKYKVKVVTLDEPPFIIVSDMDPITNACPTKQGVKCDWGNKDGSKNNESNFSDRNSSLIKCCSGYCVELLGKLANDLGFDFELYRVPDGLWGAKENKKWNGLVAELVDKKADLCVTALKVNSEREKDIDFSMPFLDTGITILVAFRDGALSPTAFLEPFEFITWVFILVASIHAAALAIFVFEWLSPQSFNRQMQPPEGHKFSLFRSCWLVWATLFSSSVETDVPRSYIARFMALVWAAFSLTFIAVYTANLAAFMITRTEFHDLEGIDDPKIMNPFDLKPPFRFGTVLSGNTDMTLRNNYRTLHNYLKKNNYFKANVSEGIAAVKRGEYDAFIYDSVVLQYLSGIDDNCEVGPVGKWFSWTGYGIGFPKKSKWLKKVNEKILKYQQEGDLERIRNFWLTGACSPKIREKKNHSLPLGIKNFVSAFVLLMGGIGISLLFLCVEFLYCNYFRFQLQKFKKRGLFGLLSLSMGRSLSFKEAVEMVHRSIKIERAKSIMFNTRREKYLESELKNVMAEIAQLKQIRDSEREEERLIELKHHFDDRASIIRHSPIKLSEFETFI